MMLYCNTVQNPNVVKLKEVLVHMGVQIKSTTLEQVTQTVEYLAKIEGYPESETSEVLPVTEEEMLVMRGFTSRRMDELLMNLGKVGVSEATLRAMMAESSCGWSFYHLHEEIRKEHKKMNL